MLVDSSADERLQQNEEFEEEDLIQELGFITSKYVFTFEWLSCSL